MIIAVPTAINGITIAQTTAAVAGSGSPYKCKTPHYSGRMTWTPSGFGFSKPFFLYSSSTFEKLNFGKEFPEVGPTIYKNYFLFIKSTSTTLASVAP